MQNDFKEEMKELEAGVKRLEWRKQKFKLIKKDPGAYFKS
jgi:hypothetical protein